MTFAWRQTACGMRHCFARRIDGCLGRRKLGCTTTRSAERHPQGVYRIRKAAKPPTAAQQRIIGAEANRVALLTRQRRAQEVQSASTKVFRGKAGNVNAFLLDGHTARFLSRERKWGGCSCGAHAAHPSARRAENPSSIFLTKNPQHGMLSAIKAARKKPFLFTRSREGTAGASPCGTEKAALLSRAAEMPRRSLRYKGTKCPASSGEFRWNHGQ